MREVDRAYWKMSVTAGGRTLEEDEEEEDRLREAAADGRQMQGLLQSDHTGWRLGWTCTCSLLNGNFSQLPAVILLTRSQNTQTNRNTQQMPGHTFLHTHARLRCQNSKLYWTWIDWMIQWRRYLWRDKLVYSKRGGSVSTEGQPRIPQHSLKRCYWFTIFSLFPVQKVVY